MTDYYNNREFFLLHAWWDNTWVTAGYCAQCGCGFPVDNIEDPKFDITFNVYKVKNELYCERDYMEIQQNHRKRGIKWSGELYFETVKGSQDLQ